MKILFATTIATTARLFLKDIMLRLIQRGDSAHIICSPDSQLSQLSGENIKVHPIPIAREISVSSDLASLKAMWHTYRIVRPQISIVGTPKAGLIGGLAALFSATPVRIYTLHGLRLETTRGFQRMLLTIIERIACFTAHSVLVVSPSLRDEAIRLRLGPRSKFKVLGMGSSHGVHAERFAPTSEWISKAKTERERLNISPDALVIGFIGRLTRDKGIVELVESFYTLQKYYPDLHLILVGDYENGDPVPSNVQTIIKNTFQIHQVDFLDDPTPYYHLMDILTLPTYREGLPNVPLEAAAAGKPVVTTDATGARDAIVHKRTGLVVQRGNTKALTLALDQLLGDRELRNRMGLEGQRWVREAFDSDKVTQQQLDFYDALWHEYLRRYVKKQRVFDSIILAIVLMLVFPIALVVAAAVYSNIGSPILFRQKRPGLHSKPFTMYKFRTMLEAHDPQGNPLSDAERLTPFGRFLRSSSLDELPELYNVLRGEMSLVGPRPLLMEYLERYTSEQARRHEVRPGITGWAQVNGRNAISWEKKFELDVWYVDNRTFGLDLKILWLTVLKVLKREGISAQGEATMSKFMGSQASSRVEI